MVIECTKLLDIWLLGSFLEALKVFINVLVSILPVGGCTANWISYLSKTSIKYAKIAISQNRLLKIFLSLLKTIQKGPYEVTMTLVCLGNFFCLDLSQMQSAQVPL